MFDDPVAPPLLSVKNVRVDFRTVSGQVNAVRGNTFHVAAGETLAIVGESGSGKSVTARAIMKMLAENATVGPETEVWFKGDNLMNASEQEMQRIRGDRITMIFQEPLTSLNPIYKIGTQVAEIIHAHRKISPENAKAEVIRLFKEVHIPSPEARFDQYPHQLSGGQRQRVMIAMALANDPDLLIADEPTTALDVTTQIEVLAAIRDIVDQFNTAAIYITHDLAVVAQMADTIKVLLRGEEVEQASTAEILENPQEDYTK